MRYFVAGLLGGAIVAVALHAPELAIFLSIAAFAFVAIDLEADRRRPY